MKRRNLIVTGYGPKGSGKSALLSDEWVARAPRVLTLDITGEAAEVYPDASARTFGLRDTLGCLYDCAEAGARAWHVLAALDRDDVNALFSKLVPPYDGKTVSLSVALGGLSVECGEVDMIAPNAGCPDPVLSAWRRGRHVALSLLCATQRPASCARDVSAQADVLFSFQTSEPRDVRFIADMMGGPVAEIVRRLPKYHYVIYPRREARVWVCDEHRAPYRCVTLDGADVPIRARVDALTGQA